MNTYTVDQLNPNSLNLNTNACIQNLAVVQQGAGESKRIGNKISLCYLDINLNLNPTATYRQYQSKIRVAIVYDRQTNGAYPSYNDIFNVLRQDGSLVGGVGPYAPPNPNNSDRFLIVWDKVALIPGGDSSTQQDSSGNCPTNEETYFWNRRINLEGLETLYSGSTLNGSGGLTIANVLTGGLYIVTLSQVSPGFEPYCITGTTRLCFRDC